MIKRYLIPAMAAVLAINACSSNPYKHTNKVYKKQAKALLKPLTELPENPTIAGLTADYQAGTVNFNLRKPNFVIIHHTAQKSTKETLRTFTISRTQVSAHYVVGRDGKVYHMLNDYLRAWHAGVARWGSLSDINSTSIGIELDNNGNEPFSELQIKSLLTLLQDLKKKYGIPTGNFIGHSDIAPRRKVDPSKYFPWERLAQNGFGFWPDINPTAVNPGFSVLSALRSIGYDTRDSVGAVSAFKLHFTPNMPFGSFSETDKALLNNVSKKYER